MSNSDNNKAAKCCRNERQRLMQDIAKCDFCSTSWQEHHRCLKAAAKKSGKRSKSCLVS